MKRFAIALAVLALIASPAFAQQPKKAVGALPSETSVLQSLHDDAAAASADAKANNDVIAQSCYDAIASLSAAKLEAGATSGGAALLAFQKVRDFTRLNASPAGTALIVGCAPLVQDAKVNFVQFFGQIGGTLLLKGIIPLP